MLLKYQPNHSVICETKILCLILKITPNLKGVKCSYSFYFLIYVQKKINLLKAFTILSFKYRNLSSTLYDPFSQGPGSNADASTMAQCHECHKC